jgi:hypothetical protein
MVVEPGTEVPGYLSNVPAGQWQKPMIVEQSLGHFTMTEA